jgi:hypothetical protein
MAPSPPSLRIVHTGCAGLRLELGSGAVIAVDPPEDPGPVDAILLTWNERERLAGAREAVRSGRVPRVAAAAPIRAWLAQHGGFEGVDLDGPHAGAQVRSEPYTPVPYATPAEGLRKLRSALLGPARAADRLVGRARLPSCDPVVLRLQLPDGRALVHLNCALHRGTPPAWLDRVSRDWAGATWLLSSWDYGEGQAFARHILAFEPQQLVIGDLVGDVRRSLGLPVEPRSLVADGLAAQGVATQLLAARTSLRFT